MPAVEALLAVGLVGFAWVLARRGSDGPVPARWWWLVLGPAALGAALWRPSRDDAALRAALPAPAASGEWTGSRACLPCHPGEHASWHRSYHRSMTQPASAESVLAPWHGRAEHPEGAVELFRRGDEYWARLPDQDLAARAQVAGVRADHVDLPRVERRVVMTTGSHHYQAYWVPGARPGELRQLPVVYHRELARFLPREAAFLQPERPPPHAARWNSNCIQCHAVAGRPGHREASDTFETSAVELGIACEACHGPGARHVAHHRSPLTRHRSRSSDTADPTIVNPARLPAERASAVCGQCHAYFVPLDEARWWDEGLSAFRAGDALGDTRLVVQRDDPRTPTLVQASLESMFWSDGTIRVGGREYNGLVRSPCFDPGDGAAGALAGPEMSRDGAAGALAGPEMSRDGAAGALAGPGAAHERRLSCLSCHSLHDSDPVDQLRRDVSSDDACQACHPGVEAQHARHAPGSAGAACVACHMPATSYALFKGIRSHRIDSPSARVALETGRPTACGLCHTDQPLAWTAGWLTRWYGAEAPPLPTEHGQVAEVVLAALRGDAAQRAIAAHALGQPEALTASGRGWQAAVLAPLLSDPYPAVRVVAARALGAVGAPPPPGYDFLADGAALAAASRAVLTGGAADGGAGTARRGSAAAAVLRTPAGAVDGAALGHWLSRRDDRAILIAE